MANWLDDPAVKALLPHAKLIEEAFGLTEAEPGATAPLVRNRNDWVGRPQSPRGLARKSHHTVKQTGTAKPALGKS